MANAPPPALAARPAAAAARAADPRWAQPHYVVKEKKFTLGHQYRVLDGQGQLVAYCKQKMFRLREDIRFYTDETQAVELFRLATQKIIDFNANFAVVDSATNQLIGSLRRKGWKSILKDEWLVFDAQGMQLGNLHEDSGFKAVLRRLGEVFGLIGAIISWLNPYRYHLMLGPEGAQREAATITERLQLYGDT